MEGKRLTKLLLCVVCGIDDEELEAPGMTMDEATLTEVVGTGMLINVEVLGGGGTNTEFDGSCRTDVVDAGLLTDVAVDLRVGTTRVNDDPPVVDLDVVVDASSETSAPKSLPPSSMLSLSTSFRSKKCPMTLGDGFGNLCRRANPGRVKLETMFEVSSTQKQQSTTTRNDAGGAIAAIVSGLAALNTLVDCQHLIQRTELVDNYKLFLLIFGQQSHRRTRKRRKNRRKTSASDFIPRWSRVHLISTPTFN